MVEKLVILKSLKLKIKNIKIDHFQSLLIKDLQIQNVKIKYKNKN